MPHQISRNATQADRRLTKLALLGFILLLAQIPIPSTLAAALPDAVTFGVRVEQGDLATVTEWLDAGLDPNFEGDRVGTGLMIAAWEGNIPMMELFVKRGADVNRANRFNEQALMHAVWQDKRAAVAWLLDHGAQINREGNEWSALHYATFAGREELARLLIQKKADVNAKSTNGSTVLMMAAREGMEKIAAMLIEAGAMRSTKNDLGEDALTWAMRNRHLTIAKMVTTNDAFAQAATQPKESWGEPANPLPAPPEVEEILQRPRLDHANGHPRTLSDEEYGQVLARVAAMKHAPAAGKQPNRMSITAKKGDPSKERAELKFGESRQRAVSHAVK